jgi:hypothetical protein
MEYRYVRRVWKPGGFGMCHEALAVAAFARAVYIGI